MIPQKVWKWHFWKCNNWKCKSKYTSPKTAKKFESSNSCNKLYNKAFFPQQYKCAILHKTKVASEIVKLPKWPQLCHSKVEGCFFFGGIRIAFEIIRPISCFSHVLMRKWEILIRLSEFLTLSWDFLNGFKWNREKFWRFHENFSLSH